MEISSDEDTTLSNEPKKQTVDSLSFNIDGDFNF